jgi:hypothetical protein
MYVLYRHTSVCVFIRSLRARQLQSSPPAPIQPCGFNPTSLRLTNNSQLQGGRCSYYLMYLVENVYVLTVICVCAMRVLEGQNKIRVFPRFPECPLIEKSRERPTTKGHGKPEASKTCIKWNQHDKDVSHDHFPVTRMVRQPALRTSVVQNRQCCPVMSDSRAALG